MTAPFPGTAILTTAVPVGLEHQAYHLFTVTAHTDGTHLGVPAKVLEMPVRVDAADCRAHEFSPDVILASATPSVAPPMSIMACRIGNALKCYGGGLGKLHGEPASTEVVPELLPEQ